jgi:hypothetical protein
MDDGNHAGGVGEVDFAQCKTLNYCVNGARLVWVGLGFASALMNEQIPKEARSLDSLPQHI